MFFRFFFERCRHKKAKKCINLNNAPPPCNCSTDIFRLFSYASWPLLNLQSKWSLHAKFHQGYFLSSGIWGTDIFQKNVKSTKNVRTEDFLDYLCFNLSDFWIFAPKSAGNPNPHFYHFYALLSQMFEFSR